MRVIGSTLNPAARVLWRSADTVQVELGSRALVLTGVDRFVVAELLGRPESPSTAEAASAVVAARSARPALSAAGFLVRRPKDGTVGASPQVPRLAAQLTALRSRLGDHAEAVLGGRRRAHVAVEGTGRLAVPVAVALAAAGVGRISFTGRGEVRLPHCLPGGLLPSDEGERFTIAASAAVRRAAPDCDTGPGSEPSAPRLVILAADGPADTEVRDALQSRAQPHLLVQLSCETASVGPLVRPARTACLRCTDLHRGERDPAWPALAVQLGRPDRYGGGADTALALVITGVTAQQALTYLDGSTPATTDGTLELQLPDWRVRRRSWPPHPLCECGAYGARHLLPE